METPDTLYTTPPPSCGAGHMPAHAQADGKQSESWSRLGKETASSPSAPAGHGTVDAENGASQTESQDGKKHLQGAGNNKRGAHIDDTISDNEDLGSSLVRQMIAASLPQQRTKAARRLMQAKDYAELVEERILNLEQRVKELSNGKTSLAPPLTKVGTSFSDHPSLLKYVPMRWIEFSSRANFDVKEHQCNWQHRPELDEVSKPVIEILIEEPRHGILPAGLGSRNSDGAKSRRASCEPPSSSTHPLSPAEPYQIRIRSKLLLKLLKQITGCSVLLGPYGHRLLMLRPFKLLVRFERRIRDYARKLAEENTERRSRMPSLTRQPTDKLPVPTGPNPEMQSTPAIDQLNLLTTVMDEYLSRSTSLEKGLSHKVTSVAFHHLWHLFKPGDEVRTPGDSQIQVYRIAKVTGGRDPVTQRETLEDKWRNALSLSAPVADHDPNHASKKLKAQGYSEGAFIIECFYIHYDSTRFGPVNATFQIRKFEGECDITALPVVPLQCYPNEAEIRERLQERGRKFIALSDPKNRAHRKYQGLTQDKSPEQVDSEVIIDFELAFIQTKIDKPSLGLQDRLVTDDVREFRDTRTSMRDICDRAGCCGNDVTFADYEVDQIECSAFRNEHRYLFDANIEDSSHLRLEHVILLPPHVYGFVLRTRRWATFDIDRLTEIPRDEKGWKNLVIDPYIKNTVLALVTNHERSPGHENTINGALSSVDLVQGKGRGLIILLHGEPGVGKTSTAECVATHTGRPLFPITCGDIGDKAETVEMNLEKNFQLAHKWGCVLLLDEADIFLSARSEHDIQRNAIVSVFLRTLEYYSGILFLTTNRVGKIDRAFKSRIHFSLLYRRLDKCRTISIWKNNIERVEKELDVTCEEHEILTFAKKHYRKLERSKHLIVWNGRQIRNAFQTSIAIAAREAYYDKSGGKDTEKPIVLNASHFEQVAKTAEQFDRYLRLASQHNDTEVALHFLERYDNYTSDDKEECQKKREKERSRRRNERKEGSESSESSQSSTEDDEEHEETRRPRKKQRME